MAEVAASSEAAREELPPSPAELGRLSRAAQSGFQAAYERGMRLGGISIKYLNNERVGIFNAARTAHGRTGRFDPVAAARILREAAARWGRVAQNDVSPELSAHAVRVAELFSLPPAAGPAFAPSAFLQALHARGVSVRVGSGGALVAAPADLLDDRARELLRVHRQAIIAAITKVERF